MVCGYGWVYACACVHSPVHATLRKSENNLQESVLSFHHEFCGLNADRQAWQQGSSHVPNSLLCPQKVILNLKIKIKKSLSM